MDNSHGNTNTEMDLQSSLQKYIRSAADLSSSYSRLTADQRLGVTHATVGLLFLIMGISFFFQSLLLSIGNGFIIYGIIEVVGVESFLKFLKPTDDHSGNYGVIALGVSLILIMHGWGMIGFLLELYSIYHTLKERCDSSELTGLLAVAQDFLTQRVKYLPVVRMFIGQAIEASKAGMLEDVPVHSEAVKQLETHALKESHVDGHDDSSVRDVHDETDSNKHVDQPVVEHSTAPVGKGPNTKHTGHEVQDLPVQSEKSEILAKDEIESAEIDESKQEKTTKPDHNSEAKNEHVDAAVKEGSADSKPAEQTNGHVEQHSSKHEGEGDKLAVKENKQAENSDKQVNGEVNKVSEDGAREKTNISESEHSAKQVSADIADEEKHKLDIASPEATESANSLKSENVGTGQEAVQ